MYAEAASQPQSNGAADPSGLNPFTLRGRIGRGAYFLTSATVSVLYLLVMSIAAQSRHQSLILALCLPPLMFCGLAAQVKRWHDRGKSGLMILINFIPVVGWIWAGVE